MRQEEASSDLSRYIRPFILRRMKRCSGRTARKIESTITCDFNREQKKIYSAVLAQARHEIEDNIEQRGFERSHIQIGGVNKTETKSCHPSSFLDDYHGGSGKLELDELF